MSGVPHVVNFGFDAMRSGHRWLAGGRAPETTATNGRPCCRIWLRRVHVLPTSDMAMLYEHVYGRYPCTTIDVFATVAQGRVIRKLPHIHCGAPANMI